MSTEAHLAALRALYPEPVVEELLATLVRSPGARLIVQARAHHLPGEPPAQPGECAVAAGCYALQAGSTPSERAKFPPGDPCDLWPLAAEDWKPSDPIQDAMLAGALLAAELDAASPKTPATGAAT